MRHRRRRKAVCGHSSGMNKHEDRIRPSGTGRKVKRKELQSPNKDSGLVTFCPFQLCRLLLNRTIIYFNIRAADLSYQGRLEILNSVKIQVFGRRKEPAWAGWSESIQHLPWKISILSIFQRFRSIMFLWRAWFVYINPSKRSTICNASEGTFRFKLDYFWIYLIKKI